MHIYAFGSICRGDISTTSDIDLLAIVDGHDGRFNPNDYSIYSYRRIQQIWSEGNPFAWHLASESKLLFTSDQTDFLTSLGVPSRYGRAGEDCLKFYTLFSQAKRSMETDPSTTTFDLSMVFLAIRNFATCFSLGVLGQPDFSRRSAIRIGGYSLQIEKQAFACFERARILSTRAIGPPINETDTATAKKAFPEIQAWMERLLREVRDHD